MHGNKKFEVNIGTNVIDILKNAEPENEGSQEIFELDLMAFYMFRRREGMVSVWRKYCGNMRKSNSL